MGRGDLTDEQWAMPEPLLPKGTRMGRPPVWPRRQLIDGIRFRVRTGVPWRDVPVEYGPWGRIYALFRRWQRNGTWHRVLTQLQSLADAKGAITWDLSVDSTVCRAHQHAAGARVRGELQKEPPGGVFTEPGEHGLRRSRGGFTTKLHLAVEQGQKPLSIVVTAGQRGDSPQFKPVLENVRVPRIGPGDRASAPIECALTRRMPPEKTVPTCGTEGSAAPSLTRPTKRAPAAISALTAVAHRVSTRSTITSVMRSSAGSTASRETVPSLRDTTSLRSDTKRPSFSRPSTSGCDHSCSALHADQLIPLVP